MMTGEEVERKIDVMANDSETAWKYVYMCPDLWDLLQDHLDSPEGTYLSSIQGTHNEIEIVQDRNCPPDTLYFVIEPLDKEE